MKRTLLPLFLFFALTLPVFSQITPPDSVLFSAKDSVYSPEFTIAYPHEIAIWWNVWSVIGAQVDTIWVERKTPLGWSRVRFYNELTGAEDTTLVKSRPIDVIVPIHARPTTFRLATGGKQTDTIKAFIR